MDQCWFSFVAYVSLPLITNNNFKKKKAKAARKIKVVGNRRLSSKKTYTKQSSLWDEKKRVLFISVIGEELPFSFECWSLTPVISARKASLLRWERPTYTLASGNGSVIQHVTINFHELLCSAKHKRVYLRATTEFHVYLDLIYTLSTRSERWGNHDSKWDRAIVPSFTDTSMLEWNCKTTEGRFHKH